MANDPFEKAKNYAFLLLKYRPRSEKELAQRLKRKKFEEKIILRTLSFLKEKKFIDDDYFAGAWIDSRLKRPLGLRRIRQELLIKGVDKEIIERQLEEIREDYYEADVVRGLAEKQFSRSKTVDLRKAKARVYAYLMRRGFSAQAVINALNGLTEKS